MAIMISTGAHYHWVKRISASTHGNGALKITLHGESDENLQQFNEAEIVIFTDNVDLTDRMIAAINGAAKPVVPDNIIPLDSATEDLVRREMARVL